MTEDPIHGFRRVAAYGSVSVTICETQTNTGTSPQFTLQMSECTLCSQYMDFLFFFFLEQYEVKLSEK